MSDGNRRELRVLGWLIGAEATDLVKMPFGLDLEVGTKHGAGTVVLVEGVKMLQVPLWRSYFAGCILLGIAPCTAMVLVWGYLARGNDGLTLIMVPPPTSVTPVASSPTSPTPPASLSPVATMPTAI